MTPTPINAPPAALSTPPGAAIVTCMPAHIPASMPTSIPGSNTSMMPNGSTNIHDSLQLSFSIKDFGKKVRRSSKKKRKNKYDVGVAMGFDTIFLLSDGSPTKPPGDKPDSTEKILEGVRVWNSLKRVTIHCIGIGRGVNISFMQKLASENGGQFKHFLE